MSVGVPLALFARLWANRRGETATPSELAVRDGPLASLAVKYSGQFYWVEFVDIFERLLLCGLTVFAFPHKPGMRVACCQLFLLFKVFLFAQYKPIVRESHRTISLACCGYLACCVVFAGIALSETTPSRLQEFVFSVALLAAFVRAGKG